MGDSIITRLSAFLQDVPSWVYISVGLIALSFFIFLFYLLGAAHTCENSGGMILENRYGFGYSCALIDMTDYCVYGTQLKYRSNGLNYYPHYEFLELQENLVNCT